MGGGLFFTTRLRHVGIYNYPNVWLYKIVWPLFVKLAIYQMMGLFILRC
jgi:hypothetical protein